MKKELHYPRVRPLESLLKASPLLSSPSKPPSNTSWRKAWFSSLSETHTGPREGPSPAVYLYLFSPGLMWKSELCACGISTHGLLFWSFWVFYSLIIKTQQSFYVTIDLLCSTRLGKGWKTTDICVFWQPFYLFLPAMSISYLITQQQWFTVNFLGLFWL